MGFDFSGAFVVVCLASAVAGWAVIELALWAISHVYIGIV